MTTFPPGDGAVGDLLEQTHPTRRAHREHPADSGSLAHAAVMHGFQPVLLVPDDDEVSDWPPVPRQRPSAPAGAGSISAAGSHATVHVGFVPAGAREAREVHSHPEPGVAQRTAWAAPRTAARPSSEAFAGGSPVAHAPAPYTPQAMPQPLVSAALAPPPAPARPGYFLPADPGAPLAPAPAPALGAQPVRVEMPAYALPGAYPERRDGGRAAFLLVLGFVLVGVAAATSLQLFGIVDVLALVGL